MSHSEVQSGPRASRERGGLRRILAPIALTAWATLALVGGASLMVGHTYALPEPERTDAQLLAGLASIRGQVAPGQWQAVHVLYSACRCSQRIFDHLFESTRPAGYHETVLLVGADERVATRAATAGFELIQLTPRELTERFHIEAAPLMIVLDPDGRLRYAGGYSERKQSYEALDREIMERLASGASPTELPLYGCGVSKELQLALDPMGLKYGGE